MQSVERVTLIWVVGMYAAAAAYLASPFMHGSSWVLDIVKTAIGAFVGAGLAFVTTRLHDASRRKREDIAAGRLAFQLLLLQWLDCLNYRHGLRTRLDVLARGLGPSAPAWLYAYPVSYTFTPAPDVDAKSLAFLFERDRSGSALDRVMVAQQRFTDLKVRSRELVDAARAVQSKLASKLPTETGPHELSAIEQAVSADLKATARDAMLACLSLSGEENNEILKQALVQLRASIVACYPDVELPKAVTPPAQLLERNLPPLPVQIARAIASIG